MRNAHFDRGIVHRHDVNYNYDEYQKKLNPGNLPRAGMRFWFDEHMANGPLNGAMEHHTK